MSGVPLVTPASLRFGVNVGLTGRGDPAPAEAPGCGPSATGRAAAEPLDALLQQVVVDRDPEEDAAAELVRRGVRRGIGSWCVHAGSAAAMAQVIKAVRS